MIVPSWGSSPLTRGKRAPGDPMQALIRLIPAHAGKTFLVVRGGDTAPAHPRSRGENPTRLTAVEADRGSSPLTRGKHGRDIRRCRHGGLIPAHAGKTGPPSPCPPTPRAHPRSRGENVFLVLVPPVAAGSSPLTRGKPGATAAGLAGGGLIPAHAGKTRGYRRRAGRWGAHPRSRGENQPTTTRRRQTTGLIPAHAGKTAARQR